MIDPEIVYNDAAKGLFHFFGGLADATALLLSIRVFFGYRKWSEAWSAAFGAPLWRSALSGLRAELSGGGKQDRDRAALLSTFPALLAAGLFVLYPLGAMAFWGFGGAEALAHRWEATNAQFFAMQMTAASMLGAGFGAGTLAGLAFRIAFWVAVVHIPHAFVWRLWSRAKSPHEALAGIEPRLADDLAWAAKDGKARERALNEEEEIAKAIDDELSKARGLAEERKTKPAPRDGRL